MDQHNFSDNPQNTAASLEGTNDVNDAAEGARPVASAERIKSIDAIRGLALLGILLMNIPGFGMNWDYWYPIITHARSGYDYYTYAAVEVFFSGTMRGLFSMLFGAGMMLFLMNKKEAPGKPSVSVYYFRRLLWLVFFGIINGFVILWWGDILYFYGLCGMLLFAFRKAAPKWLLILGIACIAFAMIRQQWSWNEQRAKRADYWAGVVAKTRKQKPTQEQQAAIGWWNDRLSHSAPDTAEMNENLRQMHGNYAAVFKQLLPQNVEMESSGVYFGLWDVLAMMFIGMALFKWGFFSDKLKTSTYFMWMLVGYGVGIPVGLTLLDADFLWTQNPGEFIDRWKSHPFIFGEFRRLGITIGHASLMMLLFRSKLVPWLMKALAAVGQMAFTNYLMQSIICTLFFYGYGAGYYGILKLHQVYYVVGIVWVVQMIYSVIWLRYFRFGPFEWLWRSLTYWKKQPMKL